MGDIGDSPLMKEKLGTRQVKRNFVSNFIMKENTKRWTFLAYQEALDEDEYVAWDAFCTKDSGFSAMTGWSNAIVGGDDKGVLSCRITLPKTSWQTLGNLQKCKQHLFHLLIYLDC